MQGAGLQLSPREPPTLGRLFIITELSARRRARTTHEPGMSLWSTHPTRGWPFWCAAGGPAQWPLPPPIPLTHLAGAGSNLGLVSQALLRALIQSREGSGEGGNDSTELGCRFVSFTPSVNAIESVLLPH